LKAVQTVNAYLDALEAVRSIAENHRTLPIIRQESDRWYDVEFALKKMSESEDETSLWKRSKGKRSRSQTAEDDSSTVSYRVVQLSLPPPHQWPVNNLPIKSPRHANVLYAFERHANSELVKLLKVADIEIPTSLQEAVSLRRRQNGQLGSDDAIEYRDGLGIPRRRPKTLYEQSRERFVNGIDWNRFHQVYKQTLEEDQMEQDVEGLIYKDRNIRRKFIARIVSNVRFAGDPGNSSEPDGVEIPVTEQLIAFRRLSLLLDDYAEELHLEEFGKYWETMTIVLTPHRNASAFRRKRDKRARETGFRFTLHHDNTVTVHVPIDFHDEELLQELDRNLWHFYNLIDDGMEGIFPSY
jgi:hypothetical protein